MTRQEIVKFINDNDVERIINYNNKLFDTLKELNKRNDRLTLFLIVIVLAYFLTSKATFSSLQFGPFSVNDFTLIPKLTPLLFAYFLLEFALLNGHRADILKTMKWIHLSLYKQELTKKDYEEGQYSFFTRLILPFSRWTEIYKVSDDKPIGCIGLFILTPLTIFLLLPFYFEIITIKNVINNYWADWIGKASVILSIWLILIVIYYYIKLAPSRYQTAFKEKIE